MHQYCRGGGIGRRVGLKHQWGQPRAGSIPALGTILDFFLASSHLNFYFKREGAGLVPLVCGRGRSSLSTEVFVKSTPLF